VSRKEFQKVYDRLGVQAGLSFLSLSFVRENTQRKLPSINLDFDFTVTFSVFWTLAGFSSEFFVEI
jgi:hypothetical protein